MTELTWVPKAFADFPGPLADRLADPDTSTLSGPLAG